MTGVLTSGLATNSIFTKNSSSLRPFSFAPLVACSVTTLWLLEGSGAGGGGLVSGIFGSDSAIVGEKRRRKGARIRVVAAAAIYLAFSIY